jgi:hypothetical protein
VARELGNGGGEVNSVQIYHGGVSPSGWLLVTSPTPDQGSRRIRGVVSSSTEKFALGALGADIGTYQWFTLPQFRWTGTLSASDEVKFLFSHNSITTGYYLKAVQESGDTYKIELWEQSLFSDTKRGTSNSTYTAGSTPDDIAVRIQTKTDVDHVKVELNGIIEIDVDTALPASGQWTGAILGLEGNGTSQFVYFTHPAIWRGDSLADRPDTDVEVYLIHPNGDGKSDEYGSDSDCSDASGTSTDWLLSSDAPNTASYLCEQGAAAGKEFSTLGTAAITSGKVLSGVVWRGYGQANTSGKTVDTYGMIRDDAATPNESEGQLSNLGNATWRGRVAVFVLPPDGDANWDDFISSNVFNHASASEHLEIGVRSVDTNEANDEWAAGVIEMVVVSDDPGGTSRRYRGQVI